MVKLVTKEVECGDVVYLKSGSPKMTVVAVREAAGNVLAEVDVVFCKYEDGEIRRATFPAAALFITKPWGRVADTASDPFYDLDR